MDIIERYMALANEFGSLMTDILIEGRDVDPDLVDMSWKHFDYSVKRSNSIVILIQNNAFWDAEILARPLIECTVRLCFVCYSPREERRTLVKEYNESLYEINKLEQSEKAKKSLTIAPARDRGRVLLEGLILSSEEEDRIRASWPKSRRQALKQKWSFSEMVRQLDKWTKPFFKADLFSAFIHSYGISSHLIHADESGIGVINDRERRADQERHMMDTAHMHNLLDLVLVSSMLMTAGLSIALNIRVEEAAKLASDFDDIHSYKEPVVEHLVEKWRHMYKNIDQL